MIPNSRSGASDQKTLRTEGDDAWRTSPEPLPRTFESTSRPRSHQLARLQEDRREALERERRPVGAALHPYYGYVILIGTDKAYLSQRIGGGVTTLGIPMGIGMIVFAFILTAIYMVWANKIYDPEVERLKGQLKPQ